QGVAAIGHVRLRQRREDDVGSVIAIAIPIERNEASRGIDELATARYGIKVNSQFPVIRGPRHRFKHATQNFENTETIPAMRREVIWITIANRIQCHMDLLKIEAVVVKTGDGAGNDGVWVGGDPAIRIHERILKAQRVSRNARQEERRAS